MPGGGTGSRPFPRQFWLLAAGTLVYLVGIDMAYPFQAIYFSRDLGLSTTAVGIILGLTLLATLPLQVVGGALCDRLGRRPLLIVSICGSMTLFLGLGLTSNVALIVVLVTVEAGLGWAQYATASNAMVADLTPVEQRAEAFSIVRVALNTGMTLGPLVGGLLIARDPSFRLNFLGGCLVCGVFLAMVVFLFRETRPPATAATPIGATFRGYGHVLRDRRMLAFCLVALFPLFGFGQIWVTLPIMLGDLHDVPVPLWSFTLVVYGACTALLQYPVVRLLCRFDHMLLLAFASTCVGIGMGAAAFVPWPLTIACIVTVSLGIVILLPIAATVVSRLAPVELRGRYMGAWTLVYIGGYSLGPLLGGWALEALGGRGAFALIAAAGLTGAALFTLQRGRLPSGAGAGRGEPAEAVAAELAGAAPAGPVTQIPPLCEHESGSAPRTTRRPTP